jgi:hypothetical protein
MYQPLRSDGSCDVSLDAFQIGDKITLESGPFITQEATVQEIKTPIMFWFWNQWIAP